MKNYFIILYVLLWGFSLSLIYANQSEEHTYYKDSFYRIVCNKLNDDIENFRKNIENDFPSLQSKNIDAIIFSSEELTSSLLKTNLTQQTIKNLEWLSKKAASSNIKLYYEIQLSKLNGSSVNKITTTTILDNINRIVRNFKIDGIFFSEVDFAQPKEVELFEDILVKSALVKPYIKIATTLKSSNTNISLCSNFLADGIIDFLVDDSNNYLIILNPAIEIKSDKLLDKYLKRLKPESFVSLDLSNLSFNKEDEVIIQPRNEIKSITSDNKIYFITTEKNDSIKLKIGSKTLSISKSDWVIPYDYKLNLDNSVSRYENWIEFRRPFNRNTHSSTYNLLCRTKYPAKVFVNNEEVKIYRTGVFFNKIKLNEGFNKLTAIAEFENKERAIYEDEIFYSILSTKQISDSLKVDIASILPNENLTLLNNDNLTVSFNGSKSQKGQIEINPGNILFDCIKIDYTNSSKYIAQIPLKDFSNEKQYNIKIILKPEENSTDLIPFEKTLKNSFEVKDIYKMPFLETTDNNSILTFTLAPIRLGAPIRNELPKSVIFKSNGIFGDYYRIKLNDTEEGYINKDFVKELSPNTIEPSYFINPITSLPTETADVVKIPFLESVPFDVYPDPYQKRIVINLYGVKTSSTWIIHRNKLRFIEEVTWQQTSKETYKIYINLATDKIWGYDIKPVGKELIFRLKYPPVYNLESSKPLKGIKISIEAGHGGSSLGAVGLSGLKEKEINLQLSRKLESLFKKYGAEVFQVRDSDKDMLLLEKRNLAINSNANIHFSIHANSSDPEDEFLGTSGTCTFYNNPFWAKFAESIFYKLIQLDLKPFGSVGSFNYRVTRMSEMPSILVEQAFMSNAEDEEKLADENFRNKMAQKIYEGLIDYLKYMSK